MLRRVIHFRYTLVSKYMIQSELWFRISLCDYNHHESAPLLYFDLFSMLHEYGHIYEQETHAGYKHF
ncbi:phosphatidylinositol 3-kinase, root isoform [Iris pallida]|uniref:Phosphatidylinositol 3-kinase, root isoform n=1 Tax=Iris pallida TaxID=29817 RepID=A0AAX6DMC2_IRIPA|nr:phosphatidylinositol 3-kinase, root isoform [Iris pallida]